MDRLGGATMVVLAVVMVITYSCNAYAFNSFSITTTPRYYTNLQQKQFARQQQWQHSAHYFDTRRCRRRITTTTAQPTRLFSSSINDGDEDNEPPTQEVEVVTESLTTSQIESIRDKSFLSNIKRAFTSSSSGTNKKKKKLDRAALSKMGMSALLAYGFVSNVSGVIAVSSAWFIFSKKVKQNIICTKYEL